MIDQDLLSRVAKRIADEKGISLPAAPNTTTAGQAPSTTELSLETDPGAFQPEALPEWGIEGAAGLLNSVGSGAMEAIFQTKDMITGEPEQGDKSEFRQQHEADLNQLRDAGWQNNVTSAISQFGLGLLGAGKIMAPLKATSTGGRLRPFNRRDADFCVRNLCSGSGGCCCSAC